MALDTEDIKLITGLQGKMEDRLVAAIQGVGSGIRAKMESEVDRIDENDKKRNNKIEKLEKQTTITRWAHRNPRVAIIAFVIFMFSVAVGYHTINFKRTAEKILKIEFREDPR